MGFAPFFDRARQGAAQVLRDFDAAEFQSRLNKVVLSIVFDASAGSREGRATLDLLARLAARLYPRVQVVSLEGASALGSELETVMRAINPAIEFLEPIGEDLHVAVIVGKSTFSADVSLYLGSDRWIAKISTETPVGSRKSENPFGAGAAACIGMANVFRAVFSDRLERSALDENVTFSLLNFETGKKATNGNLPASASIGLVQLVGVGAIGNAFVWALSHLREVEGELHLIDHEAIELTNLQRYVLARLDDENAVKVELAAKEFCGSKIRAMPFSLKWADYVAQIGHHRFDRVAVALDSAPDRVQVQGSLPRRIINSWTQEGALGISRHAFDGDAACLACLYLPTGPTRNEDEIVAGELKLLGDHNVRRVREMLYHGQPVGEGFVQEIATLTSVSLDALLPFANLPLRAFRQRAICGNALMRAQDGGGADVEVPMAFQSAMAGVMLAAETVASAAGLRSIEPATRSVVNLMRCLPARITTAVLKGTSGAAKCICEDTDYQHAYRSKYASGPAADQG
jgi:molybdopterin/thiamine biosynthesis adenylyltransferase